MKITPAPENWEQGKLRPPLHDDSGCYNRNRCRHNSK